MCVMTGPANGEVRSEIRTFVKVALANPHEVKARKGHKTDNKDAWWLAHLSRHAMVTASFIPLRPQCERCWLELNGAAS